MSTIISPQRYILPFGKYRGMYASDIAQLTVVDKNGDDKPVGLLYLQGLSEQDWFKHKEILTQIIKDSEFEISTEDEKTDMSNKQIIEEVKKPKVKKSEAKPTEKKPKKSKEPTVQINTENNVVEF